MTDPVEADLNREFARMERYERAERVISHADVHEETMRLLTKKLGARAVGWLCNVPGDTYTLWVELGTNLNEMGVDIGILVEILTECFAEGEDSDRRFSDFLDATWTRMHDRLAGEKAKEV